MEVLKIQPKQFQYAILVVCLSNVFFYFRKYWKVGFLETMALRDSYIKGFEKNKSFFYNS